MSLVSAILASVTWPIFEPSTTAITRGACRIMVWFVAASMGSWVVNPPATLRPSHPTMAVPMLASLNVFSARGPTSSNEELRRTPPVMSTRC